MKTLQRFTLGICFFTMLLLSAKSNAQISAAFSASKSTVNCPTQAINFTDNSTGNPTSWLWDFGDNTSSTIPNPTHLFSKSGKYNVKLTVQNAVPQTDTIVAVITVLGPTAQYFKTVDTVCAGMLVHFSSKASGGNPLLYNWSFGDGLSTEKLTSSITHNYNAGASYQVRLTVKDTNGCSVSIGDTLVFASAFRPLPSAGSNTLTASRECTDFQGWTHYYNDNGTPAILTDDIILLSLRKNGNVIGTVNDGTFQVKLASTQNAGTSQGIQLNSVLISNTSGYYAMNRYWSVTATKQPSTPVGVRFYFNSQDMTDINGSIPNHDAAVERLILYKTKNGNPDPTTNLSGATDITSIIYNSYSSVADNTNWIYISNGPSSSAAEFTVADLTGGGGGGITPDDQALPVKLISFNGKPENSAVKLNWTVASEVNVERFDVEASADGRTFTAIGNVQATANPASTKNYSFNDLKVSTETTKFYKLAIVDKDGKKSYSEVIKISLAGSTNAISLYPVPANNYVTVSSKSILNKTSTVEVYNSLGLKVMQVSKTAPGNSFEINTSTLPNGRYKMIILNSNNKIGDANFIILR